LVSNIIVDCSNPTGSSQTYIEAEYDLGNGRSKISRVHIRFIGLKDVPVPPPPPPNVQEGQHVPPTAVEVMNEPPIQHTAQVMEFQAPELPVVDPIIFTKQ
jgi:hypothetical protein